MLLFDSGKDWLRLRIRVYQQKVWLKRKAANFVFQIDEQGKEQKSIILVYHNLKAKNLSVELICLTTHKPPVSQTLTGRMYKKYLPNIDLLLSKLKIDTAANTCAIEESMSQGHESENEEDDDHHQT